MENPVTRENLLESIEAGRTEDWTIATSNPSSLIKNVQSCKYTSEYQAGQRRYK